jgi:hypothetical protein
MLYASKDTLLFKEIDYQFLEGFKDKLASENIKPNTISNYLRTIRAIFKAKVVDRSLYPFYDIQIKGERTQKRSITKEDILKLYKENVKIDSLPFKIEGKTAVYLIHLFVSLLDYKPYILKQIFIHRPYNNT